jgi:hypothetical protein
VADFNWKEIELSVLKNMLSTEEIVPLPKDQWPKWARDNDEFKGGWISFMGGELALSTGHLSTDEIRAQLDLERRDKRPPHLRYYRYVYVETKGGRVFQVGPFKDLEYLRRRDDRPAWLGSCCSTSTG